MAEFYDVNGLNFISDMSIGGRVVPVTYGQHHVIATKVFVGSSFLQAMQAAGLWDQNSFRMNGAALANQIGGVSASAVSLEIRDQSYNSGQLH
jgi:hypothetical protein